MRRIALLLVATTSVAGMASVPNAVARSRAPHVSAASPTAGPTSGRNVVMISGANLDQVRSVSFGAVRSPKVTHVSASSLAVTAPKHAAGTVTVHAGSASTRYRFTGPVRQLTWSRDRVIDPARGEFSQLSCGAEGFCVGVDGSYYDHQYLVAFDGKRVASTVAVPARHRGLGVACAGPSYCVAFAGRSASEWTGAQWGAWHVVLDTKQSVQQVSCAPATTDCVALTDHTTYAVHGARWQARTVPGGVQPTSVSCAAATFCVALAQQGAFTYRGTAWAKLAAPAHLAKGRLSVSCPTTTFCMSFGEYSPGSNEIGTTVSTFDGSAWSTLPDYQGPNAMGFTCQSATLCVVQLYDDGISWWRGRWSDATAVPHVRGVSAMSCSAGLCTVTDSNGTAVQHTRVRWAAAHRVSPSSGDLADVSCSSTSFCMAVDAHGNAVRYADGSWSTPQQIPGATAFTAVSCVVGRVCVAVGATSAAVYRRGRWAPAAVIDAGHRLTDVTCPTSGLCRAVDSAGRTLSWTGHWSAAVKVANGLYSIDCASATRCVAVGAVSAVLDASGWHRTTKPQRYGELDDIDCVSASWCAAAGSGGFYVWNHGVWSRPIDEDGDAIDGTVACLPSRTCIGGLDNGADTWEYAFDGASIDFTGGDELYGEKMSCLAGPRCMAVALDYVVVGSA